jgi:hypothetical protein
MQLFFSYSHKDADLRDQLEVHLSLLKRQGVIDTWHDRRIAAGDDLGSQIDKNLEQADIVLLLISSDFLNSDYCYNREMQRALERHDAGETRVVPVILRPCDWQSSLFGKLKAIPNDGKPVTKWADRDEAFLDIVREIRAIVAPINQQRSTRIAPAPVASAIPSRTLPRSSNLRVRKKFTDHDKDTFLEKSYEYVANYFEGSLLELKARNLELDTRFKRLDATHFQASVYRNGDAKARCRIWLGSGFPRGIAYAANDVGADNSYNEALSVGSDHQQLFLSALGMAFHMSGEKKEKMSPEGGAEYLWSIFVQHLQH